MLLGKNVSLHSSICKNTPENIIFDEIRLKQIIFNLLSNALKFTSSGKISLETKIYKEKNKIIFKVSDSGMGISPENIAKIGQPYFKILSNNNDFGIGMGIYFVKKHVEFLKGKFEVKSKLKKGSSVVLEFPYEEELNHRLISNANKNLESKLNKFNIKKNLNLLGLSDGPQNKIPIGHNEEKESKVKNTKKEKQIKDINRGNNNVNNYNNNENDHDHTDNFSNYDNISKNNQDLFYDPISTRRSCPLVIKENDYFSVKNLAKETSYKYNIFYNIVNNNRYFRIPLHNNKRRGYKNKNISCSAQDINHLINLRKKHNLDYVRFKKNITNNNEYERKEKFTSENICINKDKDKSQKHKNIPDFDLNSKNNSNSNRNNITNINIKESSEIKNSKMKVNKDFSKSDDEMRSCENSKQFYELNSNDSKNTTRSVKKNLKSNISFNKEKLSENFKNQSINYTNNSNSSNQNKNQMNSNSINSGSNKRDSNSFNTSEVTVIMSDSSINRHLLGVKRIKPNQIEILKGNISDSENISGSGSLLRSGTGSRSSSGISNNTIENNNPNNTNITNNISSKHRYTLVERLDSKLNCDVDLKEIINNINNNKISNQKTRLKRSNKITNQSNLDNNNFIIDTNTQVNFININEYDSTNNNHHVNLNNKIIYDLMTKRFALI